MFPGSTDRETTSIYHTYIHVYSWPAAQVTQAHRAVAHTQTAPAGSSRSPLWLSSVDGHNRREYICLCTCTRCMLPAARLTRSVCSAADPGCQCPQLVAAGHMSPRGCSPAPAAGTDHLTHTRMHTLSCLALRDSHTPQQVSPIETPLPHGISGS